MFCNEFLFLSGNIFKSYNLNFISSGGRAQMIVTYHRLSVSCLPVTQLFLLDQLHRLFRLVGFADQIGSVLC